MTYKMNPMIALLLQYVICPHLIYVHNYSLQGMEVDREQETTDRPIMGHSNDVQLDRRGEAPRSRGGLSLDTQGREEDKKAFTSMTHPTSLI